MRSLQKMSTLTLSVGAALILAACTSGSSVTPGTGVGPTSGATPSISPSSTVASTGTGGQTTASQAPDATETGAEPTVLPTNASVTVFYIAAGDGGTSGPLVGCGDSAVSVTGPAISFTDPVEGALRTLLEDHSQQIGQSGLDNALWQSRLRVDSVDRSGSPIVVNLSGTLSVAGECDIPRMEQQLLLTAHTAAGTPVDVMINGKPMTEALGLK